MKEDNFENVLRELVRDLDLPPEPPREAMWFVISAARSAQARGERRSVPFRLPVWARWAPALAAALVIGIVLGRLTDFPSPSVTSPAGPPVAETMPEPAAENAYQLVTMQHLTSAEALLAAFPVDARAGRTGEVAVWATDLLTDTRLLAETPAGEDPQIRRLLGDLELVLAQIAALRDAPRGEDVRLIEDGMNQNDVLVRLRAATGNDVVNGNLMGES